MTQQKSPAGTSPVAEAQLDKNALGLPSLVFQGITHIGPTLNVVLVFPLIALNAGPAMPLSFILTTIVCLFIGNTVAQFARYLPSSGGFYSFTSRGLGAKPGFIATWSYLIYDVIGPGGAIGYLGYLISTTIQTETGVNIPWWIFTLVTFAVVWILTHFGVALSVRTTAVLGAIELVIMIALAVTFLVHPAPGSSAVAPFVISKATHGVAGIVGGMVFSILALSGFEAPAPLAQESRRPGKFVSRAVMFSLISIGVFYVFMSYATAIGWGTNKMGAFAMNANPFLELGRSLWGYGWILIFVAMINSAIGIGLACANAATRVMYTMGKAGTLPKAFAYIHPKHKTPTFAIAFQQIFGAVVAIVVALIFGVTNVLGFLGTVGTLAVIVLYILANIALTRYVRREHRKDFSMLRHGVVPWIGTLALIPVLWVTVSPVPAYPFNLTPYVFLALMIVGLLYMLWVNRRSPGALEKGATMLVQETSDAD
jgi:amino acid transporter